MNLSKLKTVFPKAKEGIFDILERELNFKDWSTESKYQFLAQYHQIFLVHVNY